MTIDSSTLLDTWRTAERTNDAGTLDRLLAADFVGIGPVGFVLDRAAWLGRLEGQGLTYEQLDLDEVDAHRNGDVTVVVARQKAVGRSGDFPLFPDLRVAFTVVPAPDGDGARIASMQYSFMGMPAGAPAA